MHNGTLIADFQNTAERVPMVSFGFGAPPELYDRMVDTAKECGTSVAGLCRTALTSYLDGLEAEDDMERARR